MELLLLLLLLDVGHGGRLEEGLERRVSDIVGADVIGLGSDVACSDHHADCFCLTALLEAESALVGPEASHRCFPPFGGDRRRFPICCIVYRDWNTLNRLKRDQGSLLGRPLHERVP